MYPYGPHVEGWGWALGLGSLVFWILLAGVVVALVLSLTRGGQRPWRPGHGYAGAAGPYVPPGPAAAPPVASPEQILSERFARGEIDQEEFGQRMAALRAQGQPPGPGAAPS